MKKKILHFSLLLLPCFSIYSQITLVKDIVQGAGYSNPTELTEVNGNLIFTTDVPQNAPGSLWKSDGTTSGTSIIYTFGVNEKVSFSKKFNNYVYFNVGKLGGIQSLWVSEGNSAYLIKSLGSTSETGEITVFKNAMYFNTSSKFAQGIHKSDGTANGTVGFSNRTATSSLVVSGSNMFFTTYEPAYGNELWKTDGTEAGTVLVKDIRPGGTDSGISQMIDVNGTLFFVADNGVNGIELWKSDGTEAGTVMVKDITVGDMYSHTQMFNFTKVNNILYFTAKTYELWKTDGTEAGTVLVRPSTNIKPNNLINVNGVLFFECGTLSTSSEICKTDGTEAGTVIVKDLNTIGTAYGGFINPYAIGKYVFFKAQNGVNGYELWKSDGTEAGTVMVDDSNLGASNFNPTKLTSVGSKLFMVGETAAAGIELFVYDTKLSLNDNFQSIKFQIYPNPSNGSVFLDVEESLIGSKTTIINLLGQKVNEFELMSKTTLISLNKGVYMVTIEKDQIKTTKKLIVN